jgi:Family of unknown function (DUF6496)
MPKLRRTASKAAKRQRMHEEMTKFRKGALHSGSKKGPVVRDRAQAIAIGLSESGQSKRKVGRKKGRRKRGRKR